MEEENILEIRFKRTARIFCIVCIILFGIGLANYSLNEDSRVRDYTGIQNVINGDAAGYYVYLPAFFIYHFSPERFPDKTPEHGGNGFHYENNKVHSKYTFGLAMAYSPFFLGAHCIAKDKSGYSRDYHRAVRLAAVFYCTLGLLFCFLFFSIYVNQFVALILLIPLFCGTSLMYSTLKIPAFSHIISFCLITGFVYCVAIFKRNPRHWCKWCLPFLFGFIMSVRIINGIVILLIPFWDYTNLKDLLTYSKKLFKDYKFIIAFICCVLLFQTPQFLYNIYLHGTIWSEPYPGEHFTNIAHPRLKVVLFGAENGLYIYTPLFLLFTICNLYSLQEKFRNGLLILFFFFTIGLIYASWYTPTMGICCFSHRVFTDYIGLFAFPFVWTMDSLLKNKKYIVIIITGIVVYLFCSLTLHIYAFYWYCYYGKGYWDYFWLINDYFNFHHLKSQ